MPQPSRPYHFGDLLALAREHWVRQMAAHVAGLGFTDYRRSDAAAMRLLGRGPRSIGQIGEGLGVSRQAARKLVTRLEQRDFATVTRDARDGRQLNVELTDTGRRYEQAIREAIAALDRRLQDSVTPEQLETADAVLRATLPHQAARDRAERLVPPPGPSDQSPPES